MLRYFGFPPENELTEELSFKPSHSQASQRAGVTLALLAMRFVINACPVTIMAAEINPQMNGGSQEPVALVAQIDHGHFARQILQRLRHVGLVVFFRTLPKA
jgi:hypothetical protein